MNLGITPNFNTNRIQLNKTKQNQGFGASYTVSSRLKPIIQEIVESNQAPGAMAVLNKMLRGGRNRKGSAPIHVSFIYKDPCDKTLEVRFLREYDGGGVSGFSRYIDFAPLEASNDNRAMKNLFNHLKDD